MIKSIIEATACHFRISKADLLRSSDRVAGVARHIAFYLARTLARKPTKEIAAAFGVKAATVLYGVKRIVQTKDEFSEIAHAIAEISDHVNLRHGAPAKGGASRVDDSLTEGRTRLVGLLAARAEVQALDANGPKPMTLLWAVDKVRGHLELHRINFVEKPHEDSHVFEGVVSDSDIKPVDTFFFRLIVEEDPGLIQCFLKVPTHAAKTVRTSAAAYCSYVSDLVKQMKLSVDPRDGEVQTELSIPISALLGDAEQELARLFILPMAILECHLKGLYDVLGGKPAEKAFFESLEDDDEEDDDDEEVGGGEGSSGSQAGKTIAPLKAPSAAASGARTANVSLALAKDYSLEGLNLVTPVSLERIVSAVRRFYSDKRTQDPDAPRLNLLLSGPPGTGKSEFVKYLASCVKAPLEIVRASDLLSEYVGKTERNLAAVFARAAARKAILFFDEIDSFLQSREASTHGWEVSQVNELLQQMESFVGVMVGATNFVDYLDKAVLRRFTYKLKLDYLTDDGKLVFFNRYFKVPLSGEECLRLKAITNLTPGDFRTVRQQLYYLNDKPTKAQYLAALEAESAAKGIGSARIGF